MLDIKLKQNLIHPCTFTVYTQSRYTQTRDPDL